jgi:hypothetical protein
MTCDGTPKRGSFYHSIRHFFLPPQHFMIMIFFCPKWICQNMEGGIRCWWIYNPANVSDVFPTTFCPAAEDRRRALKYLSAAAAAQPPIDRSPPFT